MGMVVVVGLVALQTQPLAALVRALLVPEALRLLQTQQRPQGLTEGRRV